MLKAATKSLMEDKPETVKKIVVHKVKIIKQDGKIIKKPYKIVFKKSAKSPSAKPAKIETQVLTRSRIPNTKQGSG